MFAARANQENTVHHPQYTKSLAPKTPSGKTPFRGGGVGKNDENSLHLPGKQDGGAGAQGKPDSNAFVTPANPRTRAPLGNKTTNAKGVLQPAAAVTKPPASSGGKTRRAHPKIKVHAPTTAEAENILLEQEREIEYMPPREIPMKDYALDEEIFPRDRDLSCLTGRNLTRGWYAEFAPEVKEDDGELSDFAGKVRKAEKKRLGGTGMVGSVKARGAVGALSTNTSGAAALRGGGRKPLAGKESTMRGSVHGNPRFTAAKVASNSTIGYSKGRVVSRPKLGAATAKRVEKKTALDDLLTGFGDLGIDDAEADALGLGGGEIQGEEEDGEIFQLEALGEDF